MLDPVEFDFCSEFYVVEKIIEVVVPLWGENRHVRIDALRSRDGNPAYSAAAYLREYVTLTRSRPGSGEVQLETAVWTQFPDFPWTARNSADEVLQQALGFIYDRSRASAKLG